MPINELATYVLFHLSQGNNTDPVVKALTVEEVEKVVRVTMGTLKLDGGVVPNDYMPLFMCLAKKEMYWKLATASAPLNAVEVDGIKVEKETRFEHYFELIKQIEAEYQSILKDPNRLPEDGSFGGRVTSLDTIIDKPYCRSAYLQTYKLPKISANVDKIDTEFIYISVSLGKLVKEDYLKTTIMSCNSQIIDEYENSINSHAKTEYLDYDIRRTKFKIPRKDVTHILIQVTLKNGLSAYYELEVKENVIS